MSTVANFLPIKSQAEAIEEAKNLIELERSGRITGLYTRFEGINRAKMKYWRLRSVTCLSGMSGSGKSAILNILEDDFTNPILNPTFNMKFNHAKNSWDWDGKPILEPKIIVVAFKYEMDAADEILRNLSGKVAKSYSYLLSSEKMIKDKDGKILPSGYTTPAIYNTISDSEYQAYVAELERQKDRPIVYIENAGNLDQLYNTCVHVQENYPGRRLIITVDHTLLSLKLTEKDDLELMSRTAKMSIKLKKNLNAAVIFVSQLNGNIEDVRRRENPDLHFPVKTDIHAANQIFWACDDVIVFHRPEILDISKYGKKPFPMNSKDLIHCAWIKSRKNKTGHIWFQNQFDKGKIIQVEPEVMKSTNDTMLL